MNDLEKIIVITGGGRGIGAATARLAASNGYKVCINYKSNQAAAEKLGEEINGLVVQADISKEDDVKRLFSTVDDKLGRISALVNNAGIPGPRLPISKIDKDVLDSLFDINVAGAFLCAREAVQRMAKCHGGPGGAIVNVSSQAAISGGHHLSAYAASKAAVSTMTIALANEMSGEDVRVNAVSPGVINTDQQDFSDSSQLSKAENNIPMGRIGTPEEVAALILWLLSPAASYIHGSIIPITGGK